MKKELSQFGCGKAISKTAAVGFASGVIVSLHSNVQQHQSVCDFYLHSLGCRLQLCYRVVIRQDVRHLALSNQRREGGQSLLQLADPLLLSL